MASHRVHSSASHSQGAVVAAEAVRAVFVAAGDGGGGAAVAEKSRAEDQETCCIVGKLETLTMLAASRLGKAEVAVAASFLQQPQLDDPAESVSSFAADCSVDQTHSSSANWDAAEHKRHHIQAVTKGQECHRWCRNGL